MYHIVKDGFEQREIEAESTGKGKFDISAILVVDNRLIQDRIPEGFTNGRLV